jgi:predicted NAD-dependent protein-ADP-ribosyltransferase YbiA (DUF1768 family)
MSEQSQIFTPETDGIDHVNVYSRAKTEGGRLLSNFAHTPFTLYGIRFESVEGFYQSMLFDEDQVRAVIAGTFGNEAKSWGKKSPKREGDAVRTWDGRVVEFKGEEFHEEIEKAIREKTQQNPSVAAALIATGDLPLTHYYVMWGRPIAPKGETAWLETLLTSLRKELGDEAKGGTHSI